MVAGVAHLVAPTFGSGFYATSYFALSAVAYGLMLPAIASLHVRHSVVRQSGAVLGTIAGVSVVTLGSVAATDAGIVPATFLVSGMWWWTIGKMWAETRVLQRAFGWFTMAFALLSLALLAAYAFSGGVLMAVPDLPLRVLLGVWLIALAALLWREAR